MKKDIYTTMKDLEDLVLGFMAYTFSVNSVKVKVVSSDEPWAGLTDSELNLYINLKPHLNKDGTMNYRAVLNTVVHEMTHIVDGHVLFPAERRKDPYFLAACEHMAESAAADLFGYDLGPQHDIYYIREEPSLHRITGKKRGKDIELEEVIKYLRKNRKFQVAPKPVTIKISMNCNQQGQSNQESKSNQTNQPSQQAEQKKPSNRQNNQTNQSNCQSDQDGQQSQSSCQGNQNNQSGQQGQSSCQSNQNNQEGQQGQCEGQSGQQSNQTGKQGQSNNQERRSGNQDGMEGALGNQNTSQSRSDTRGNQPNQSQSGGQDNLDGPSSNELTDEKREPRTGQNTKSLLDKIRSINQLVNKGKGTKDALESGEIQALAIDNKIISFSEVSKTGREKRDTILQEIGIPQEKATMEEVVKLIRHRGVSKSGTGGEMDIPRDVPVWKLALKRKIRKVLLQRKTHKKFLTTDFVVRREEDDEPNTKVLIDTSGSMGDLPFEAVKTIRKLRPKAEVAYFDTKIHVPTKKNKIVIGGGTDIDLALEYLVNQKKSVEKILITDMEDSINKTLLTTYLKQGGIIITMHPDYKKFHRNIIYVKV